MRKENKKIREIKSKAVVFHKEKRRNRNIPSLRKFIVCSFKSIDVKLTPNILDSMIREVLEIVISEYRKEYSKKVLS